MLYPCATLTITCPTPSHPCHPETALTISTSPTPSPTPCHLYLTCAISHLMLSPTLHHLDHTCAISTMPAPSPHCLCHLLPHTVSHPCAASHMHGTTDICRNHGE